MSSRLMKHVSDIVGKTVLTTDLVIGVAVKQEYRKHKKGYLIKKDETNCWYPVSSVSQVNYKISKEMLEGFTLLKIILENPNFVLKNEQIINAIATLKHVYFCQSKGLQKTLLALTKEKTFLARIRMAFWISAALNLLLGSILIGFLLNYLF